MFCIQGDLYVVSGWFGVERPALYKLEASIVGCRQFLFGGFWPLWGSKLTFPGANLTHLWALKPPNKKLATVLFCLSDAMEDNSAPLHLLGPTCLKFDPSKAHLEPKGRKTAELKNWRAFCSVSSTSKQAVAHNSWSQPRRQTQGVPTALWGPVWPPALERWVWNPKAGPKTAEQKIGERPVLFLPTSGGLHRTMWSFTNPGTIPGRKYKISPNHPGCKKGTVAAEASSFIYLPQRLLALKLPKRNTRSENKYLAHHLVQ